MDRSIHRKSHLLVGQRSFRDQAAKKLNYQRTATTVLDFRSDLDSDVALLLENYLTSRRDLEIGWCTANYLFTVNLPMASPFFTVDC